MVDVAIKAIETTYNNTRFRSRLEARWACLFDALGITWYYEHEGYETPHGWYLPDFWLPDVTVNRAKGVLFEVKPDNWQDDIDLHPEVVGSTAEPWIPATPHLQLEHVARKLDVGGMLTRGFRYSEGYWQGLEEVVPWWDHPMMIYPCTCGAVSFRFAEGHFLHEPHCEKSNPFRIERTVHDAYVVAKAYRFWEGK